MGITWGAYQKDFVPYTFTKSKYTREQHYQEKLILDWGVPFVKVASLSKRRLKKLYKSLKAGLNNITSHRTLLTDYRRQAQVTQIYR